VKRRVSWRKAKAQIGAVAPRKEKSDSILRESDDHVSEELFNSHYEQIK
jgi:hypothetical protein